MNKVEIPLDVQAALQRLYTELPVPLHISVITTGAGGHVGTWMLGTPGEATYPSPHSLGSPDSTRD
jgi:hypothetical protein